MVKYISILILYFFSFNWAHSNVFDEKNLPAVIKNLIKENKRDCKSLKDLNNREGQYQIGYGLHQMNILNHKITYIIYSPEGTICTAAASFDQGSGGRHLIIFANPDNKWKKIYDAMVFDYKLVSPQNRQDNIPTNLIIYNKGNPGFTVDEIEYEWDIKNNTYFEKSIKKDIYNANFKK